MRLYVQNSSVTLMQGKALLPRQIISPVWKLGHFQQYGPGLVELRYESSQPEKNMARLFNR